MTPWQAWPLLAIGLTPAMASLACAEDLPAATPDVAERTSSSVTTAGRTAEGGADSRALYSEGGRTRGWQWRPPLTTRAMDTPAADDQRVVGDTTALSHDNAGSAPRCDSGGVIGATVYLHRDGFVFAVPVAAIDCR